MLLLVVVMMMTFSEVPAAEVTASGGRNGDSQQCEYRTNIV
jgi:hypothetical protein